MKNNKNEVQLYGTLMDIQPEEFFKDGDKFKRFYVGTKRTSGNVDLLPVAIPERMAENWKSWSRKVCLGLFYWPRRPMMTAIYSRRRQKTAQQKAPWEPLNPLRSIMTWDLF